MGKRPFTLYFVFSIVVGSVSFFSLFIVLFLLLAFEMLCTLLSSNSKSRYTINSDSGQCDYCLFSVSGVEFTALYLLCFFSCCCLLEAATYALCLECV